MSDDLLEVIPPPDDVKRRLAKHRRAVELLRKLLQLAEFKQRLEGPAPKAAPDGPDGRTIRRRGAGGRS